MKKEDLDALYSWLDKMISESEQMLKKYVENNKFDLALDEKSTVETYEFIKCAMYDPDTYGCEFFKEDDGNTVEETTWRSTMTHWFCGSCGFAIGSDQPIIKSKETPSIKYCPNCGRRITKYE